MSGKRAASDRLSWSFAPEDSVRRIGLPAQGLDGGAAAGVGGGVALWLVTAIAAQWLD